ncbi:MAG TPA: DUF2069 domain-containing protein [Gammaproteobacteria bacterium]
MIKLLRPGRAPVIAALAVLSLWLAFWLGALTADTLPQRSLWLMLALVPLLIVVIAVWRDKKGGYAWCGFLSLGYLAQGITVAWTGAAQSYAGAIEIFLSIVLFAAASGALRARRGQP